MNVVHCLTQSSYSKDSGTAPAFKNAPSATRRHVLLQTPTTAAVHACSL